MGMDLNQRTTSIYFANWGIFASSLALLLKTVPVPALLDHPCHGGHEETEWFLFSDFV